MNTTASPAPAAAFAALITGWTVDELLDYFGRAFAADRFGDKQEEMAIVRAEVNRRAAAADRIAAARLARRAAEEAFRNGVTVDDSAARAARAAARRLARREAEAAARS